MRLLTKILTLALATCLVVSALPAQSMWAEEEVTANTPLPDIAALQAQVDAASADYDDATRQIAELEKEIAGLDSRIAEIQKQLPEARELSNSAAREYYCMLSTSNPFLEMIFGATSLAEFFTKVEYSTRLNQSYIDDMTLLSSLSTELEDARAELETKKQTVKEEQRRAEEALLDAQYARDEAEETARKISEASAAATAAAAEAAAAEAHTPEVPLMPGEDTAGASIPPATPDAPESPTDKQTFVNLWAPRIDAYLAGSPLAGYGYAFANAAFDYNVDPRWSPAISCIESSMGRYCYASYNAWGWGGINYPNWETAIYAHIRGLSVGYGYTISIEAAKKYCANWEHWYNSVSAQMAKI